MYALFPSPLGGLFFRTIIPTNSQKLVPIIGYAAKGYYWTKLFSIIGNCCPKNMRLAALYKLFLCTYLFAEHTKV